MASIRKIKNNMENYMADSIANPCNRCPYRNCTDKDHCSEYLRYFRSCLGLK